MSFYVIDIFTLKALLMLLGKVVVLHPFLLALRYFRIRVGCLFPATTHHQVHVSSQTSHIFPLQAQTKTINATQRFDGIIVCKPYLMGIFHTNNSFACGLFEQIPHNHYRFLCTVRIHISPTMRLMYTALILYRFIRLSRV